MATGGFKLSLAGAKSKPGLKAPLAQPAKKRRLALDEDEPEDDNGKQEISGWDAAEGGAVDAHAKKEEPKGPWVIPALPNRDWREEARKRQIARTRAPPAENGDKGEQMEQPKMAFGLNTFTKKDDNEQEKPQPMDVDDGFIRFDDADENLTEEQKLQAEAFDALINGKSADAAVIPMSEEEALRNDIRDAPDAPTLEAYEATPIEGFGAAMLRGMGWKDGESLGKNKKPVEKPKEIKRRPALLGIGAKPEAAVGIELGEWGQEGKKKYQAQTQKKYNPVALRNKRTGELITEEEFKKRLEAQRLADEKQARNNTFVDDVDEDDRKREKRREKKSDYDSDRRRDKSHRDERRQDRDDEYSDRDRRREKKYSEYEDSDRDRRRDRKYRDDDYDDRRREKRRDKDSRYRDRSRSPYEEERREKRRERDRRERSVDSDDYRREKRRERGRRERDRSRSRDSDDRRRKRRD